VSFEPLTGSVPLTGLEHEEQISESCTNIGEKYTFKVSEV